MSDELSPMTSADRLLKAFSAADLMRKHLLPSVGVAQQYVSHRRLVEDHYGKTIADMAGTVIIPLAGINVTLHTPAAESTTLELPPDTIFTACYVEYTTGFKLRVWATVALDEGYYPLGVSWKAFEDSLAIQLELLFNSAGYTTHGHEISGLRNMSNVGLNNVRFQRFFQMDEAILRAYGNSESTPSVEFEETETHLIMRRPIDSVALGSKYSDYELLYGDTKVNETRRLVRRSDMGILASSLLTRFWFPSQQLREKCKAEGFKQPTYAMTPLDKKSIKHRTRVKNENYPYRHNDSFINQKYDYDRAYAFLPAQPAMKIEGLQNFDLSLEGDMLVVRCVKDWATDDSRYSYGNLHVDDPERWMVVSTAQVMELGDKLDIYTPCPIREDELQYLRESMEARVVKAPPPELEAPALTLAAEQPYMQHPPTPGPWLRITRAWTAFWSDEL